MTRADVLIIGGGIAGIGAGAELAADRSVCVLEAERQIGYHATGRSAAIFIRNYGNATLRALNAAAAGFLEAPEGYDLRAWPLFVSASERWYAKPEAGKLMVSPADEDPVEPHDAWADDMVLAEGLYRFEQAVSISVTRVEHSWAGLRSFAPDRTPVVGHDPECEGFFWLAGQGGYGVQTAPALSRLTADLVAVVQPLGRHGK